jgi:hypothetical protein
MDARDIAKVLPGFRAAVEALSRSLARLGGAWLRPGPRARPFAAATAAGASNIHGTGYGLRMRGGRIGDDLVLKIFVVRKVPAAVLAPPALLMKRYRGIPVDVEEIPVSPVLPPLPGPETAREAVPPNRRRVRPVVGGVSIAPLGQSYVGTLGCFVRKGGRLHALSNNHVLANVDSLPPGTPIVQPGPESRPSSRRDVFARLAEAVPVRFGRNERNEIDAAIARVEAGRLARGGALFQMPGGPIPYDPSRTVPPRPGLEVAKVGRSSGLTRGVVVDVALDGIRVNYGSEELPAVSAPFRGILVVRAGDPREPFSLPGDSGSLIVEAATGRPVAVLFAGGPAAVGRRGEVLWHTLAFPFRTAARLMGIEPA